MIAKTMIVSDFETILENLPNLMENDSRLKSSTQSMNHPLDASSACISLEM